VRTIPAPRIVLTVSEAAAQAEPDIAARKHALYADGVRRHGAIPVMLDATADQMERDAAFAAMDGLLLTGGTDIHPSRYGHASAGSRDIEHDRDALEAEAWAAAAIRGIPVLGICRGFQAINVFAGGTLLQHVDGHAGPRWGHGPAATHPMRYDPASRVGGVLANATPGADADVGADPPGDDPGVAAGVGPQGDPSLVVNSYHHQAVRESDLAPGLRACGWAESPEGEIVEAFELDGARFVAGVQCHPERTESTPPEFQRLWAAFVEACRR
jgi:putative glutamine amidotransferase